MGELFAWDRIGDIEMELAPLPRSGDPTLLLERGDLLFARQSLKLEGAGRCVIMMEVPRPTTWEGHILRARLDRSRARPDFFYYWFRSPQGRSAVSQIVEQVAAAGIRGSDLSRLAVPQPAVSEQAAIARLLSGLDDKIDSINRTVDVARRLGTALLALSVQEGSRYALLGTVSASIARGIAPKYADEVSGSPVVLNQRCIRDGFVSTGPARRTIDRSVPPEKVASAGDILVNSTGAGTLGRVGRWQGPKALVDSHVTVVKPDAKLCPPNVLAYSLLGSQAEIEGLATGSTGQTELSRERLASLRINLPSGGLAELERELAAIEQRIDGARRESEALASLRDELLRALMSGRLTAAEAQEAVAYAG
jgi:type I restriction enzyme S subunit